MSLNIKKLFFTMVIFLIFFLLFARESLAGEIFKEESVKIRSYVGPENLVSFTGRTCPNCNVYLLRSGQLVSSKLSDQDGFFQVEEKKIEEGSYLFGLYAVDNDNRQSLISNYYVNINSSRGIVMLFSDILLSPTFSVNKLIVSTEDSLIFFGKTVPNSLVQIRLDGEELGLISLKSDSDGFFYYQASTKEMIAGNHKAEARTFFSSLVSPWGRIVEFEILNEEKSGEKKDKTLESKESNKEMKEKNDICNQSDLNEDNKVDISDLSILFFWHGKKSYPREVDLNHDSKIDLVDFSILVYCWG